MRVLVLSQYYPPEGAAAFYASSLARELAARGHSVRVLTGFPNYPSGKLFSGYKLRWRERETEPSGVEVLRVPLYIDHSQNAIKRIANYVTFGLSAATAGSWARGADVVYVYATQMTPAIGPWLRRLFGGAPYVLHIQDLWPDSIVGSSLVEHPYVGRVIDRLLGPWLRSVYRRASAVVAIAPTMAETLASRGVPRGNLHVVYNWGSKHAPPRRYLRQDGESSQRTEILYAGNVGDMQDLETVVRAAHLAKDEGVHITIVGDGVALPRVRRLAEHLRVDNVHFKGRVAMEETGPFYAEADFSLVTLKDLPAFRGTIPSKFQASMAHALPVITTVQGDLRDLVGSEEVGICAEPENPESVAQAFRTAALRTASERAEMAARCQRLYAQAFSIEAGVSTLETILQSSRD